MLHVDFKNWPCRPVEFRGREPSERTTLPTSTQVTTTSLWRSGRCGKNGEKNIYLFRTPPEAYGYSTHGKQKGYVLLMSSSGIGCVFLVIG